MPSRKSWCYINTAPMWQASSRLVEWKLTAFEMAIRDTWNLLSKDLKCEINQFHGFQVMPPPLLHQIVPMPSWYANVKLAKKISKNPLWNTIYFATHNFIFIQYPETWGYHESLYRPLLCLLANLVFQSENFCSSISRVWKYWEEKLILLT